jgi:hypothetical protein
MAHLMSLVLPCCPAVWKTAPGGTEMDPAQPIQAIMAGMWYVH